MWSRLSNALKVRSDTDASAAKTTQPAAAVRRAPEQSQQLLHPSGFHRDAGSEQHLPLPAPSPPSSPSRHGRLGLFKRTSKAVRGDHNDQSSFRLPNIHLPKRVRSSLHVNADTNGSNISLPRPSLDIPASPRPSTDTATVPVPQTPQDMQRIPSNVVLSSNASATGSIRSILRDRNTPGSGQNVRFFSRDAYRVISPDPSVASPDISRSDNTASEGSNPQEPSFRQRLEQGGAEMSPEPSQPGQETTRYHSADAHSPISPQSSVTSPGLGEASPAPANRTSAYLDAKSQSQSPLLHNTMSVIQPVPPPEVSDLFDLSAAGEHGVHAIPLTTGHALHDGAVEVDDDGDGEGEVLGQMSSPASRSRTSSQDKDKENVLPQQSPNATNALAAPISLSPLASTSTFDHMASAPSAASLLHVDGKGKDKRQSRSLGRISGASFLSALSNVLSDADKDNSTVNASAANASAGAQQSRPASTLGLYRLFSGGNASSSNVAVNVSTNDIAAGEAEKTSSSNSSGANELADSVSAQAASRARALSERVFRRPASIAAAPATSSTNNTNGASDTINNVTSNTFSSPAANDAAAEAADANAETIQFKRTSSGSKSASSITRPHSEINDTSAVIVFQSGNTPTSTPGRAELMRCSMPPPPHAYAQQSAVVPDPFRADARTYYTPDAGVPNSPLRPEEFSQAQAQAQIHQPQPQHARSASASSSVAMSIASRMSSKSSKSSVHQSGYSTSNTSQSSLGLSRTHSQGDSIVHSSADEADLLALRTQLTFHQELSTQYELDLSARDELVSVLSSQLSATKSELETRTRFARAARAKVAQLEKACRGLERACSALEDEVERSRMETAERSVMDEASGEALRALHGVIAKLEKENERLKGELGMVRESAGGDRRSMILVGGDKSGHVGDKSVGDSVLRARIDELEQQLARAQEAEFTWEEERSDLQARLAELESEKAMLTERDAEVTVLKAEVEAQWAGTERMNAHIDELKQENMKLQDEARELRSVKERTKGEDGELKSEKERLEAENVALRKEAEAMKEEVVALKEEVAAHEARMSEIETEWTEGENRRAEVERELEETWAVREQLERERQQLREDVAATTEQLEQARHDLATTEAQMTGLQEEHRFATENIARLESLLSERAKELSEYQQKLSAQTQELEIVRDDLSALRREHTRATAEAARTTADANAREASAHGLMEDAMRERAAAELQLVSLREQVPQLKEEVEKLRRQVHDAKHVSADLEVKIMQMTKQHERDEEDKAGLNIALDSKQQELELLKRRLGLSGTAGSTTTTAAKVGTRRESAAFTTPMHTRPSSVLSDNGSKTIKADPSAAARQPLSRTGRANSASNVLPPSTIKVKAARKSLAAVGMPPPPSAVRPRHSLSSSMSSASSVSASASMSRSTTTKPVTTTTKPATGLAASTSSVTGTTTAQRRMSSVNPMSRSLSSKAALMRSASMPGDASDASSAVSEKENATPRARPASVAGGVGVTAAPVSKAARRVSVVPKPLPA